jgi:hypothetical protein
VWQPAPLLTLLSAEQVILEAVADSASADIPDRVRKRAGIVLRAAEGIPNHRIAQDLSISRTNVLHWRGRFLAQGIRGLWDVERVPLRERIPEAVEQAVVSDCLYRPRLSMLIEDNDPSLRWTVRNLALRHGISRASVGRICQKHGIEMAGLNGINLAKLKISPDPLFAVTVYQIGGLLYETVGPVLSFCSSARPFSELSFSSLPAAGRNLLIDRMVGEFRKLEKRRHDSFYTKLSNNECWDPAVDRFIQFAMAIAAKHAEAQNHLLLHLGAPDYPPVQEWLATQPHIQLHRAPLAPPNGAQWTELAEHWLKVIAAWPMQASLVDSVQRMTQLLATYPPGQLDQLVIIV